MSTPAWSATAWQAISPILNSILRHPFLDGLRRGVLDKGKFLHYLSQDALYLEDFSKVLAGIAMKLRDSGQRDSFLSFASECIAVERALHQVYLGQLDAAIRPMPSCLLYTSFLHRQLAIAPVATAVASILPCFWVYKAAGDYLKEQPAMTDNPYQEWINTYAGEEFAESARQAIAVADALAAAATGAGREEMTKTFVLCSQLEWMFCDAAWRLEKWPGDF